MNLQPHLREMKVKRILKIGSGMLLAELLLAQLETKCGTGPLADL